MSCALVVVRKTLGGHTWSNTHAVQIGGSPSGIPSDTDLTTIGAAAALTDTNTNGSPLNFIQRLVAFERWMHLPDVAVTGVYITDGKRASTTPGATEYATLSCNLGGLIGGFTSGGPVEPGAVTLLLHRNMSGFSVKPGRMWLRCSLLENHVKGGVGNKMIDWESSTIQSNYIGYLSTAVSKGLNLHYFGGVNAADAQYALPRYYSTRTAPSTRDVGALSYVTPIVSLSVVGPAIHQVPRGRRRRQTA